ncbi:MAG TPA: 6-phosphofructokinase, partial [Clostridiales bacterium]|nr:6-phosphofructokinase [Clostridiales bacterium]
HAGYLALNSGLAVGATSILLPEVDFNVERDVIERMRRTQKTGKKHFIIMVAEGVAESMKTQGINGVGELAKLIEQRTGVETRATVLGHVQRGGSPSVKDRVVASQMGAAATLLLKEGKGNRVIAMRKEEIVDYDIYEALSMKKSIDLNLLKTALEISI